MNYEIRVLTIEHMPLMIHVCSHASDQVAIQKACALASDADCVEVWRGQRCVFMDPPYLRVSDPRTLAGHGTER